MRRFYLPRLAALTLHGDEARHARQVLRLQAGDTLTVFDGRGKEAHCRVAACHADTMALELIQATTTPPLACRITLAQAAPKKSMELIVQKATELGVAAIAPVVSERTVAQLDEDCHKLDRWRAISLESCKQCGNNWLPEILPPVPLRRFLDGLGAFDLKLIGSLQPDARPLKELLPATPPRSALVIIGPEGDFTPAELAAARSAGCLPLSLGPLVLRSETAALYTLSILHHELHAG